MHLAIPRLRTITSQDIDRAPSPAASESEQEPQPEDGLALARSASRASLNSSVNEDSRSDLSDEDDLEPEPVPAQHHAGLQAHLQQMQLALYPTPVRRAAEALCEATVATALITGVTVLASELTAGLMHAFSSDPIDSQTAAWIGLGAGLGLSALNLCGMVCRRL